MERVPPESVGLSSERLRRLDAALQRSVDRGDVAGVVTLLLRRGRVVHSVCCGQMDLATRSPMREDALFRIFSMTKPITSLAVLMLYEEGHFHLGTPIAQFIPAFGDVRVLAGQTDEGPVLEKLARPITIHDLLTHTSGLGYGLLPSDPVETLYHQERMLRMDEPLADKVQRLTALPLHHQPGLRYTYSMATDVLGRLVEIVSGMPLDAFLKQRLFEPLGMVDTDFYVLPEKRARLATLYTSVPDVGLADVAALPGDPDQFPFGAWTDKAAKPRFLSGGGGLVSTAADYLRFALLLRNGGELDGVRCVSRKTIELMTSNVLRADQLFAPGFGYGLGVAVMLDPARAQMLGSPGAFGGGGAANTDFWLDPREDLIGVLMTQYIAVAPCSLSLDFKVLAAQAIVD